ncbi:MAG: glutathione S-transferase family protein [Steroidobacteraceae bacterium]
MLKLFFHQRSTFSRRVRIALLEKQIPFEPILIDMAVREHKSEAYLSRNPYGRVPAIDDDGFLLYESASILMYLEASQPQPPLVPVDAQGRALVDLHMRLCDLQFARHAGTIIFPRRFLPSERWDHSAMDLARREIKLHFAILAAQLGEASYLVRDRFSLADIAYLPILQFLPLMEIDLAPNLAAWCERLLSRPSAKATVPDQ